MSGTFKSYVALGDSLSEGLGDFNFSQQRIHSGWTDRLAALLAKECQASGEEFRYSNQAIRGAKISDIMGAQLKAALQLKPDLVTIMAGQNNLLSSANNIPHLEAQLKAGIVQLQEIGCFVLLSNTINPLHLRVFRPLAKLATHMTDMIERVADELNVPLHDIHRMESLTNPAYWAEDMVHFSGPGHIKVANKAAEALKLTYRISEFDDCEIAQPNRGPIGTSIWIFKHVLPFFWRKLRGVSAGDGLTPKIPKLAKYVGLSYDFEHIDYHRPGNFGSYDYTKVS